MTAESDDFIILLARSHNAVSVLLLCFHGDKFKQRLRSPSTHEQYIVNKVRKIHFEPDSVQQRLPRCHGEEKLRCHVYFKCYWHFLHFRVPVQRKTLIVGLHKMTCELQITTDPDRSHKMSKIAQIKFMDPYSEALMRSRNEKTWSNGVTASTFLPADP